MFSCAMSKTGKADNATFRNEFLAFINVVPEKIFWIPGTKLENTGTFLQYFFIQPALDPSSGQIQKLMPPSISRSHMTHKACVARH